MMTLVRLLACFLLPTLAAGDDWRALVEEALDQRTDLDIENCPLTEAFDEVVKNTGVQVRVSQQTLDLLPYGRNTRMNARIQNMSLREGLMQMTAPLGLRFEVEDRGIVLLPRPALERIGRPATWDELETLAWLPKQEFGKNPTVLEELAGRLQFQVGEPDPWPMLGRAVRAVGAGRGDRVLTLACESLGWTWYPSGRHIAVVRLIDQQLRRPISVRQTSRKLIDVLQAIGQEAGVNVVCEPGVLAALPPQTRSNFSLYIENKPLGDALQLVAATTGLGFEVAPDAIVFFHPGMPEQGASPPPQPAARPADPYVGKITLPPGPDGVQIDLLIHESDLSPEVNELRLKYLERANQAIKEALLRLEQSE